MREGVEYIAVVLNCASSADRFQSAKQLLNYGFAAYTLARPDPATEIPSVPVILGAVETVTPVLQEDAPVLLEKDKQNTFQTKVQVDSQVKAPVEAGQRLGTLILQTEGEVLREVPLVAPEEIARLSWWDLTQELLRYLCFCG